MDTFPKPSESCDSPPPEMLPGTPSRLTTRGVSPPPRPSKRRRTPSPSTSRGGSFPLRRLMSRKNIRPLKDIITEMQGWNQLYLQERQKLILIVDLDQTLINSCDCDLFAQYTNVPKLSPLNYWIKIRPGACEFLQAASVGFELVVVSMGEADYADYIVQLIDPDQSLFGGRLITAKQLNSKQSKLEVMNYIPEDARDLVVVIDDYRPAWGQMPIIAVKPYSILEDLNKDEEELGRMIMEEKARNPHADLMLEDTDNYLLTTCIKYLHTIHKACYTDNADPVQAKTALATISIETSNNR